LFPGIYITTHGLGACWDIRYLSFTRCNIHSISSISKKCPNINNCPPRSSTTPPRSLAPLLFLLLRCRPRVPPPHQNPQQHQAHTPPVQMSTMTITPRGRPRPMKTRQIQIPTRCAPSQSAQVQAYYSAHSTPIPHSNPSPTPILQPVIPFKSVSPPWTTQTALLYLPQPNSKASPLTPTPLPLTPPRVSPT